MCKVLHIFLLTFEESAHTYAWNSGQLLGLILSFHDESQQLHYGSQAWKQAPLHNEVISNPVSVISYYF